MKKAPSNEITLILTEEQTKLILEALHKAYFDCFIDRPAVKLLHKDIVKQAKPQFEPNIRYEG